jgi:hypothetical protein
MGENWPNLVTLFTYHIRALQTAASNADSQRGIRAKLVRTFFLPVFVGFGVDFINRFSACNLQARLPRPGTQISHKKLYFDGFFEPLNIFV